LFLQVPQLTEGHPLYVNKYEMCIKYTQFSLSLKLEAWMSIDVRKNLYAVSPLVWSVL